MMDRLVGHNKRVSFSRPLSIWIVEGNSGLGAAGTVEESVGGDRDEADEWQRERGPRAGEHERAE